jgi:drug/metabolite transporter (DMT)-like permease
MIPAIITTFLFAMSAVSAGRSTRLLGGTTANFCRLVLATLCLGCWAHLFGRGIGGGGLQWFFLSGVIGFGIGDLGLYGAYPRIGPRLGVLLCLCLAVPIGAVFEWLWLGTTLTLYQIVWSAVILAGVIMAVVPERVDMGHARQWGMGILMGTIAAMGQAGGAVFTRKAYAVSQFTVDGGTAAYQRILGGLSLTIVVLVIHRFFRSKGFINETQSIAYLPWKQAWPWVVTNSLTGPALGVACFQWALAIAPTGIVLAIVATTPLVVIPFTWVIDHERPHIYSLFGGVLAVAGAAALVFAANPNVQ